jgi:serine/threonine protein phosphatase PrpC
MFLDDDTIHVANVGDSRAVIATMSDGKLVAQPLSVDQTPYRSDERERVKRSGARVLTMDQLEGIAPIHDVSLFFFFVFFRFEESILTNKYTEELGNQFE